MHRISAKKAYKFILTTKSGQIYFLSFADIGISPLMGSMWYREGLRFECTQCGDCCTGDPGYVWVTRAEAKRLEDYLKLSTEEFRRRYIRKVGRRYSLRERANGECVLYSNGCKVYPVRPRQCRTFPFWPEHLETAKAWEEIEEKCPGIGKGRLFAPEEIQLIRRGEASAEG